jgi:hypothetical protein
MKTSETKTAHSTSGGYFKVSVVKISARSDEVKGGSSVAQLSVLDEKSVLRKTQNKFEKLKIRFLMILWTICYGESDDRIGSHIECTLAIFIDVAGSSTANCFSM